MFPARNTVPAQPPTVTAASGTAKPRASSPTRLTATGGPSRPPELRQANRPAAQAPETGAGGFGAGLVGSGGIEIGPLHAQETAVSVLHAGNQAGEAPRRLRMRQGRREA